MRDLVYERICQHGDTEGVLQLLLDKVAKSCRPEVQDWQILRQMSEPSERCLSAGKAVSTVRGLARTFLAVLKRKKPVFRCDDTFTDAAVAHQTRSVGSHTIHDKRHKYDT